jgi:hypothetical protein
VARCPPQSGAWQLVQTSHCSVVARGRCEWGRQELRQGARCILIAGVPIPIPGAGARNRHLAAGVLVLVPSASSWSLRQKSQLWGGGFPSFLRGWKMDFEGLKKSHYELEWGSARALKSLQL